jgi:hypothetical protein
MCGRAFVLDDPKILVTTRYVEIDEQTQRQQELFFQPARRNSLDPDDTLTAVKTVLLLEKVDPAILRVLGTTPCRQASKHGDFS